MDLQAFRGGISGKVTAVSEAEYENLRRELVWNEFKPARCPRLIVQAVNERDVIEAVRFARANGMKIAERGGGHSWVGFSLRDESLLIDLVRLDRVSIDLAPRKASVGPAIIGRDLNRQLIAQ